MATAKGERAITVAAIAAVVVWTSALGAGCWLGPKLFTSTSLKYPKTGTTPSDRATQFLVKAFPSMSDDDRPPLYFLIESVSTAPVLDPRVQAYEVAPDMQYAAMHRASTCCTPLADEGRHSTSLALVNSTLRAQFNDTIAMVEGYYLVPLPVRRSFVTSDNRTSLLVVTYTKDPFPVYDYVKSHLIGAGNVPNESLFRVTLTGFDPLNAAASASSQKDFEKMDYVSLPLAMVVLMFVLHNPLLLPIPLLNIAVSLLVSMALTYLLSQLVYVANFVAPVVVCLTLALGIDYALFILSRFREEVRAGSPWRDAVVKSLRTAGRTVLVSSVTASASFAALMFVPVPTLSSLAIAGLVTIVCVSAVSLTLTPAMLVLCEGVLHPASKCGALANTCSWGKLAHSISPRKGKAQGAFSKAAPPASSAWLKLGYLVQDHPALTLLLVLGISVPVMMQAPKLKAQYGLWCALPAEDPAVLAYGRMSAAFGAGRVEPYQLLMESRSANAILSDTFFNEAGRAIKAMSAATGPPISAVQGVTVSGDQNKTLNLQEAQALLDPSNNSPAAERYKIQYYLTTNADSFRNTSVVYTEI
eukprot:gene393-2422_t